jgi:hypothetical protein
MATLKYIGVPAQWDSSPAAGNDLVDVSYINQLLASNMTMQQATTQFNQLLSGYATQSWANSQYSALVTPATAASQVANYQNASTIGTASGPVALQYATGQVNPAQIAAPSTQTFPSPFWSPNSYLTGNTSVGVGNAPVALFTVAIPAQSYSPYVLACFGSIDTESTVSAYILTVVSGTEGTFTFGLGGVSTAAIPYNASATTIQSAMGAAFGTVASGSSVTGTGPFAINFTPLTGGSLTVTTAAGTFGTTPVVKLVPTGQPVITVQTPSNQVIATGYGSPTNYQGAAPGAVSSQAFLGSTSTATGSFATIPSWTAYNAQGFTTTMSGNYLQIPQSGTATLTASVNFSGASAGAGGTSVFTQLQIVNNAGQVLAGQVNPSVGGNSGTATTTWTGTLTQNTLYTVQAVQYQIATGVYTIGTSGNPTGTTTNPFNSTVVVFSPGTFGTWVSGTFTLTPPPAQNTQDATVMPTSLAAQTPLTGATTLTAYLGTVGNAGGAIATTLDPGLWVMPLPWM